MWLTIHSNRPHSAAAEFCRCRRAVRIGNAEGDETNSVGFHHAGIGSWPGWVNLFESAFQL